MTTLPEGFVKAISDWSFPKEFAGEIWNTAAGYFYRAGLEDAAKIVEEDDCGANKAHKSADRAHTLWIAAAIRKLKGADDAAR